MITSGFFNSVSGDRKYNAEQMNTFLAGIVSENGVYENVGDKLQVIPIDGMTIGINTGKASIHHHWFYNDSVEEIGIEASDITLKRYDAIVLRYSVENRNITPIVIKGTNSINPVYPEIVRNTSTYDICLAYVYIGAGVSTITQSNIIDTRLNNDICGYITGLIKQVDTSQLFKQWQAACEELFADFTTWSEEQRAAFDTWFSTLTEQLGIITYIQEYKSKQTTTADTTTLLINIPEYNPETDSLFVSNYGLMFVEGVDYTVSGTGENAQLNFTGNIIADQVIECRVLKSVIGSKSI